MQLIKPIVITAMKYPEKDIEDESLQEALDNILGFVAFIK